VCELLNDSGVWDEYIKKSTVQCDYNELRKLIIKIADNQN